MFHPVLQVSIAQLTTRLSPAILHSKRISDALIRNCGSGSGKALTGTAKRTRRGQSVGLDGRSECKSLLGKEDVPVMSVGISLRAKKTI
jgi:hypothetical protein